MLLNLNHIGQIALPVIDVDRAEAFYRCPKTKCSKDRRSPNYSPTCTPLGSAVLLWSLARRSGAMIDGAAYGPFQPSGLSTTEPAASTVPSISQMASTRPADGCLARRVPFPTGYRLRHG